MYERTYLPFDCIKLNYFYSLLLEQDLYKIKLSDDRKIFFFLSTTVHYLWKGETVIFTKTILSEI